MTISEQLRAIIKREKITAYALSHATGISQKQLGRFLKDDAALTQANLDKIAKLLGIKLTIERPLKVKWRTKMRSKPSEK